MISSGSVREGFFALGAFELVEALAGFAATDAGKKIVAKADLAGTESEAVKLLSETVAMVDLIEKRPDLDIPPVGDIPSLLIKANKSLTLTGEEIVAFVPLLQAAQKIKTIFSSENIDEQNPLFAFLPSIHGLLELIEDSLDGEGMVKENATPQIEALTKSVNTLRSTIRKKAEALLSDPIIAPTLQEEYVTLRENRFVLPIRAEHKTHVEGILHDSSNSGQTFYIEPKVLVDLNNRLKSAEMELAAEIEKLLAELSRLIAEEGESIIRTL